MSIVDKIAADLGETEKTPLIQIGRVVKVLGEERTLTLLDEALKVEAEAGLLTDDGSQRRTAGGVFFKLVKNQTTSQERGKIFAPRTAPKPKMKPLSWEESEQLSNEVLSLPAGEATKVKVTIVGRPGRIIEKESVVITGMQNSKPPKLPQGLPIPPGDPTTYVVYIALKQWQKVKEPFTQNPDDKLIVEGYPLFDKRIGKTGAMTIYAQSVTTTHMQRAQREMQKA